MASRRLALLAVGVTTGLLATALPAAASTFTPLNTAPHSTAPNAKSFPAIVDKPLDSGGQASAGSAFTPMSPTRVLDTRTGAGQGGTVRPVGENGRITLNLSSVIPANATSVVLNLTATNVSTYTNVTAWPDGEAQPDSSNLNLIPHDTRANLATVAVGANRSVDLWNRFGTLDLIADIAGYYAPGSGSLFTSQAPNRVLDTRDGTGQGGAVRPVGPNQKIVLDLSSVLPTTATAVVLNLTADGATDYTVVTAWPDGGAQPNASNLNVQAHQTTPNLVTVAVPASRKIDLSNVVGSVNLIADLAGYYATDRGNPFYSLTPVRAADSRAGGGPFGPGDVKSLNMSYWLPSDASAVVFNLTGTNTTSTTFVTAWPAGAALPNASNLNLAAGQTAPNLVIVATGANSAVNFRNNLGNVDLIVDLAGYFATPPQPCAAKCVYAMGTNSDGQLGNGNTGGGSLTPTAIPGLPNVVAAVGGVTNGYALRGDGTVWGWGDNYTAELGNGASVGFSTRPYPVSALDGGVTAIAGDGQTGYALKSDGTVWSWGDNTHSQTGNGATGIVTVPTRVQVTGGGNLTGVTQIAAAETTGYALKADGTVWSWGTNVYGELGTGQSSSTEDRVATQIPGLTGVTSIGAIVSGGYAVKSDGTLWAWGDNSYGQLGTTTSGSGSAVPVQVSGLTGVHAVASGVSLTGYALKNDGTVWAWGDNQSGQFGNGTSGSVSSVAVQVSGLTGVTSVASGNGGALALKSDGSVWTWGGNATSSPAQITSIGRAASAIGGGAAVYIVVP
jgi:alpha-tubulin suppressor-like RCC1 family protein